MKFSLDRCHCICNSIWPFSICEMKYLIQTRQDSVLVKDQLSASINYRPVMPYKVDKNPTSLAQLPSGRYITNPLVWNNLDITCLQ